MKNRCPICRAFLSFAALSGATLAFSAAQASAAPTAVIERETLALSRKLKPIPDAEWREIAGNRISEKYEVGPGDTLYDISKRLFGDPKYWPKIWALNNNSILNPHWIKPGMLIAFMPGTGTALPSVSIESATDAGGNGLFSESSSLKQDSDGTLETPYSRNRSKASASAGKARDEWRLLPPQRWEKAQLEASLFGPSVKRLASAAERESMRPLTREMPSIVASTPLSPLGQVVGSTYPQVYFGRYDHVLIQPFADLKIGETYALVNSPQKLPERSKGRPGYAYEIQGEAKIIGSRDGNWVAVITQLRDLVMRGTALLPAQPSLADIEPVPGLSPIFGKFYVDRTRSSYLSAQHSIGYINLGTDDGVGVGMIFQSFEYHDPIARKKVLESDVFPTTDLQVIQTSEKYSLVRVVYGGKELPEGTSVRLLTDLSQFTQRAHWDENLFDDGHPAPVGTPIGIGDEKAPEEEKKPVPTPEQDSDELGEEDKKTLKQLERYDETQTPEATPAPSTPEAAPDTHPSAAPDAHSTPESLPAAPDLMSEPFPSDTPASTPSSVPNPQPESMPLDNSLSLEPVPPGEPTPLPPVQGQLTDPDPFPTLAPAH